MTVTLFITQQISQYDKARLLGIRLLQSYDFAHGWQGLCTSDYVPGKCLIEVAKPSRRFPHREGLALILDEAEYRVFVAGHEVHHWLCHTKQLKAPDTERRADQFGRRWLWKFRIRRIIALFN